jgi:ATP-dependent Lon protease
MKGNSTQEIREWINRYNREIPILMTQDETSARELNEKIKDFIQKELNKVRKEDLKRIQEIIDIMKETDEAYEAYRGLVDEKDINPNDTCRHCKTVRKLKNGIEVTHINLASSFPCKKCAEYFGEEIPN